MSLYPKSYFPRRWRRLRPCGRRCIPPHAHPNLDLEPDPDLDRSPKRIELFLLDRTLPQMGVTAPLEAFKTATKGWGIRATDTIEEGTYICLYAGEVCTHTGRSTNSTTSSSSSSSSISFSAITCTPFDESRYDCSSLTVLFARR